MGVRKGVGLPGESRAGARRAGELIAVRPEGDTAWLYPAWQWQNGRPRPEVPRILAAARAAGLDERALYERMTMRSGLAASGDETLAQLLVTGHGDRVVEAIGRAR